MEQGTNAAARGVATSTPRHDDRRRAADRRLARRGAAHDARLALATARALLATQLERAPGLPHDVIACLDAAARELDRVTVLLGPDVGRPDDAVCDVTAVARDVAATVGSATGVPVRCHGHAVFARADVTSVWRVLTNLVDNACRAAGRAGTVTVTASNGDRPGAVVVGVHDTGPGLAPPWRAGIGLDVVRGLVADLGGSVDVTAAPGGGADVRITLARAMTARPAAGCVTA